MSTIVQAGSEPGKVETSLSYLIDSSEKPFTYMYEPPAGVPAMSLRSSRYPAAISNGRLILGDLSLDRQGFVLVNHDTAVRDFYDADEVRKLYYHEVEQLVKKATGAI